MDFVIKARVKTAVKELGGIKMNKKLRRRMLFCPASDPKMLVNAPIYGPDCIIFDLEDAVAYNEKDSARDLLCEALKTIDYGKCEVLLE